jgi:putative DNA primase/helicase
LAHQWKDEVPVSSRSSVHHGTGANGKSTFINALAGALGSYAVTVPMQVFARSDGRDADSLATLASARLLTAAEAEEGRGWSDARIKALTGGDPIAARFAGQPFFNFVPRFKLMFAANRMPGLSRVDEAIRRRFHRIPFDVTIPAAERDPDLPAKLRAEWPAILRWAIDGAASWRVIGLTPSVGVRRASERYLDAEDAFSQWRAECAALAPEGWESSGDLFASWKAWAAKANELAGSQKRFGQALEDRGFQPKREGGGRRGYMGLSLYRPDTGAAAPRNHASDASHASHASRPEPGLRAADPAQTLPTDGDDHDIDRASQLDTLA